MKASLLSTLFHTLELVVVVGIAYVLVKVFRVDSSTQQGLIVLVLAALSKFARSSDKIPMPDYVNGKE